MVRPPDLSFPTFEMISCMIGVQWVFTFNVEFTKQDLCFKGLKKQWWVNRWFYVLIPFGRESPYFQRKQVEVCRLNPICHISHTVKAWICLRGKHVSMCNHRESLSALIMTISGMLEMENQVKILSRSEQKLKCHCLNHHWIHLGDKPMDILDKRLSPVGALSDKWIPASGGWVGGGGGGMLGSSGNLRPYSSLSGLRGLENHKRIFTANTQGTDYSHPRLWFREHNVMCVSL